MHFSQLTDSSSLLISSIHPPHILRNHLNQAATQQLTVQLSLQLLVSSVLLFGSVLKSHDQIQGQGCHILFPLINHPTTPASSWAVRLFKRLPEEEINSVCKLWLQIAHGVK